MEFLKSFARHGFTFLGGVLVAKGVVTPEIADSFISSGTELVGGILIYGVGQLLSWNKLKKLF